MSPKILSALSDNPILAVLAMLSWMVLAIAAERLWTIGQQRRRLCHGKQVVLGHLAAGQRAAAQAAPATLPAHLGTSTLLQAMAPPTAASPPAGRLRARASRSAQSRLWLLASVGALAPFIGLLGTVLGIMDAFGAMAAEGAGGFAVVSGGLSEALVTTAAGIFVAIEAVFAFNVLRVLCGSYAWELQEAGDDVGAAWASSEPTHAGP